MSDRRDSASHGKVMRVLLRVSPLMPVFAVGVVCGISIWAWLVRPEQLARTWPFVILYCSIIVLLELRWDRFPNSAVPSHRLFVRCCFFFSALTMLVVGGMKLAITSGFIDVSWLPATKRLSGVMVGVCFMVWGNFLPKLASPWTLGTEPFDWQGVHRFGGWLLMIAGVVTVVAWLSLPARDAGVLMASVQVTAILLLIVRKYYSLLTWRGHPT